MPFLISFKYWVYTNKDLHQHKHCKNYIHWYFLKVSIYKLKYLLHRQQKFYIEAAAASNISLPEQPVNFDPDSSWLQFHLGINRYALYSRDDQNIDKLLQDMHSATIIGAGGYLSIAKILMIDNP